MPWNELTHLEWLVLRSVEEANSNVLSILDDLRVLQGMSCEERDVDEALARLWSLGYVHIERYEKETELSYYAVTESGEIALDHEFDEPEYSEIED